ncbi:MAG: FG-GAP-like repeat-containing protein [Bacteroidota bacterium]
MVTKYLKGSIAVLSLLFLQCNDFFAQGFVDANLEANLFFLVDHQGFMGGGGAFFDYDNDGELDLYVVGGEDRDRLYKNDGDGTFSEMSLAAGLDSTAAYYTHGVIAGDIDNDGDRDLFLTTWDMNNIQAFAHNLLYENNGDGTFTDISQSAGIHLDSTWSTTATFLDFNLDGYLDIYVTNYVEDTEFLRDSITNEINGFDHACFANYFYINNGNNTFTEMAAAYGIDDPGCGLAVAATDYDSDGDTDIMVANDFGEWVVPDRLYRNDYPMDGFTDVSVSSSADVGIYGMGVAVGDYNEDTHLDYYITNLGSNALLQNQGDGTFVEFAAAADVQNTEYDDLLVTSWGAAFFDYDNNTTLDLAVCNGYVPAAEFIGTTNQDPNKLYHNNGDGTFSDFSAMLNLADEAVGRGLAIGDYDKDGDVDMLIINLNAFVVDNPLVTLYKNEAAGNNNWCKVYLEGTTANRDAFGAQVWLHAAGRTFIREIGGGSSHGSQNESVAHFGLGNISQIDSIIVQWPGGDREAICSPMVNESIHLVQGNGLPLCMLTSMVNLEALGFSVTVMPNPITNESVVKLNIPRNGEITLELNDILGRKLVNIFTGEMNAGVHELSLVEVIANLPSGSYVLALSSEEGILTEKMVIAK